jgi:transcriptional regulator with XRE-family HTH domain
MGDQRSKKQSNLPSKKLIGVRIEKLRVERDMSKADLARACDTNEGNVWKWITGRQRPGLDKIGLIATALGTTTEALLAPPPGAPNDLEQQIIAELMPKARSRAERELIAESVRKTLDAAAARTLSERAQDAFPSEETATPQLPESTLPPPPEKRKRRA